MKKPQSQAVSLTHEQVEAIRETGAALMTCCPAPKDQSTATGPGATPPAPGPR
jgi:hypothetical protein